MEAKTKTAKKNTMTENKAAASQNELALRYPHGRFDSAAVPRQGAAKTRKTQLAAKS